MNSLNKIAIITPVWGDKHLHNFLDLVLPSWLSPQNIPRASEICQLHFAFLTLKSDFRRINNSHIVKILRRHCQIELIEIDDIIADVHVPVTISLAFQRGTERLFVNSGIEKFIYLNSDFLVADGGLTNLAVKILNGERLILSPSLRVTEEGVKPILDSLIDSNGILNVTPFQLAEIAFSNLHHSVIACKLDQEIITSSFPHQFYWQVDKNTLLARAFCMFTLAATVENLPPPLSAFCDYGMAMDLAPGVKPYLISSNEQFFAVELGAAKQEAEFVGLGNSSAAHNARCLARWTTQFHREQCSELVVFKSGELNIDVMRTETEKFDKKFQEILSLLPTETQPVKSHPHWISTLEEWIENRRIAGKVDTPRELGRILAEESAPQRKYPANQSKFSWLKSPFFASPNVQFPWQPYSKIYWKLLKMSERANNLGYSWFGTNFYILGHEIRILDKTCSYPTQKVWRFISVDLSNSVTAFKCLREINCINKSMVISILLYRSDGEEINALDIARALEATKMRFDFVKTELLSYSHDLKIHRLYGRIIDAIRLKRPWSFIKSIIFSMINLPRLIYENFASKKLENNRINAASAIIITGNIGSISDKDGLA